MRCRFVILTPVLDDWPSLTRLISEIDELYSALDVSFEIVVVDDGSVDPCDADMLVALQPDGCIERVSVVRLALNLGHQRAIAVGLASLADRWDIDGAIVMDSDGEDRPGDIGALIALWKANPAQVILARRAERSENAMFKVGYLAYKMTFRVLSGRRISFGNFSLLPAHALRRVVHMPELWNNLPATIIRSRLPHLTVETKRGKRYAGRSKMNLPSLVMHGLSAMSVYTDVIFVRVLLAACGVCGLALLAMSVVVMIRFATPFAIPGWATTAMGDLVIILVQALMLVVATTLMLLASRSARQLVPIADAGAFIAQRSTTAPRAPQAARMTPASV